MSPSSLYSLASPGTSHPYHPLYNVQHIHLILSISSCPSLFPSISSTSCLYSISAIIFISFILFFLTPSFLSHRLHHLHLHLSVCASPIFSHFSPSFLSSWDQSLCPHSSHQMQFHHCIPFTCITSSSHCCHHPIISISITVCITLTPPHHLSPVICSSFLCSHLPISLVHSTVPSVPIPLLYHPIAITPSPHSLLALFSPYHNELHLQKPHQLSL